MKQSDVRIVNLKMAVNGGEFIFLNPYIVKEKGG